MTTPSEIFHKEHFLNKKILELRTISCFTLQISYPHLRNLLYEATWSHLRWTRQWEEGRTDQRTRGLWCLWEMSRANQIAPQEFAFKAWTTSQDPLSNTWFGQRYTMCWIICNQKIANGVHGHREKLRESERASLSKAAMDANPLPTSRPGYVEPSLLDSKESPRSQQWWTSIPS